MQSCRQQQEPTEAAQAQVQRLGAVGIFGLQAGEDVKSRPTRPTSALPNWSGSMRPRPTAEANSQGYTLDSDVEKFMQERRQELIDELNEEVGPTLY